MEDKSNKLKKYGLKDYIFSIFEFDTYINSIYSDTNYNQEFKGYIIDYKEYQNLKAKIKYDDYIITQNNVKYLNDKISEVEKSDKNIKIEKIKPIKFKSSEDLINNLINKKNKYLLISFELFKIICHQKKEENSSYSYTIYSTYLKLDLDNNKSINFHRGYNILSENAYLILNDKHLLYLWNTIKEYYNFENDIKNKLKNNISNKDTYEGFLVSKIWIDEWKKYTDYKNIIYNFSKNGNINFDENKYKIIKEILLFQNKMKKELKFKELTKIKLINFKSIDKLEEYIINNSLAIINSNFYKLIEKDKDSSKDKLFNYSLSNKTITIYIKHIPKELSSENNIILSNKEQNLKINLKILFKIFYFQEELKNNLNLKKLQKSIPIGMVKKNWIHKFKNNYEYTILYTLFKEKITKLENIKEYNSLTDDIIEEIIDNLPNEYINIINEKEKNINNKLNFDLKKNIFESIEINNINKKSVKYINDFEIVGSDILPLKITIMKGNIVLDLIK